MSTSEPTSFGGHPRALPYLFFAEMWERFCFYGMRTILTLYMVRGFLAYSDEQASYVYGSYNSMVYLTPLLGGLLADRLLGYRRSIMMGGVFMAVGMFMLLTENHFGPEVGKLAFYGGLGFIIVGNGYFKPNISTLLGKLYKEGDPKRDAGFGIFYMGINIGAFMATLICGWVGENIGWTYGFGLAGVGMLAGILTFHSGRSTLHGHGEIPSESVYKKYAMPTLLGSIVAVPLIAILLQFHQAVGYLLAAIGVATLGYLFLVSIKEDLVQRHRMWVILVLIFFHTIFWAFFEQAGTSLTLFTARNVDRDIFGLEFPATWGQFFNPLFIVALTPVFAWLWPFLTRTRKNPSIPNKFTLGILQVGMGFYVLVIAGTMATNGKTSLALLALCYLLHTTGELFLSPVGLSMVTKLAPARMTAFVMGAWFLSIAFAHYIAGAIAALTGAAGGEGGAGLPPEQSLDIYMGVFQNIAIAAGIAALVLFVISPILKKWLHGVE